MAVLLELRQVASVRVTVTWIDDTSESYGCNDARVSDGVLFLSQRMYSSEPFHSIPLVNVRFYTVDER